MVSSFFTGQPIGEMLRCGKDPLPTPLAAGVWIFPFQSIWQGNPTPSLTEILAMLDSNRFNMMHEQAFDSVGKHRVPIFVAFTGAHDNFVPDKIDIFDAQPATRHQAQARPVE